MPSQRVEFTGSQGALAPGQIERTMHHFLDTQRHTDRILQ